MFKNGFTSRGLRRLTATLGATALLASSLAGGGGAHAQSAPAIATRTDAGLGTILTDPAGRTLYLFTKDTPGTSNCYDQCATAWPPLLSTSASIGPDDLEGVVGTTARSDGNRQVTYNGMPLYYWVKDAKPGDATGQNVGGVWFVVNPGPQPTVSVRQDAEFGTILTDAQGMTLYLFTKDTPGTSTCYDQCATAWPPLLVSSDLTGPDAVTSGLGLTTRNDGTHQATYAGMPLYYWAKDTQPGETTGQNVGGVWFIVNP